MKLMSPTESQESPKLELFYPVKDPINQGNLFGANPAEYKPLGQAGHPGNDFKSVTGTKVYAPCDGQAFWTSDSLGGSGLWIRATDSDGNNFNVILWHMPVLGTPGPDVASASEYPFQIPTDRSFTAVKAGQFLGYSDNSGYNPNPAESESTGPHLHMAVMPADKNWQALNPNNGFLGCVDPTPFYNGKFAEDIATEEQIVQRSAAVVTAISQTQLPAATKITLLDEIEAVLAKFL
jgi:murein DD-endopeptidase MepM/ murein hydrolase activator NlpD